MWAFLREISAWCCDVFLVSQFDWNWWGDDIATFKQSVEIVSDVSEYSVQLLVDRIGIFHLSLRQDYCRTGVITLELSCCFLMHGCQIQNGLVCFLLWWSGLE